MPIDLLDLGKLILGITIITIPGYLWSYVFSKKITRLERLVFGFILGILLFSVPPYVLNVFFRMTLSQNILLIIFLIYTIPVLILSCYQWLKSEKPLPQFSLFITQKNFLLLALLGFTVFMTFLPHLSQNYYLPFHVDEWIHWSYSRSIMDYGSVSFLDPYTGKGFLIDTEIGFHTLTASLSWLTTSSLLTIVLFMPTIFALFLGLTAFNIGEKTEKKFGLDACLLLSLIPTTTRYLGPSFYVAVTAGLLLLLFLVWLIQQKHYRFLILIAPLIWCLVFIHPVTAFAGVIVASIYCIMLIFEKNKKFAVVTGLNIVLASIPFIFLLTIPSRWASEIDKLLQAVVGEQTAHSIPAIYVNFSDLGIITWILFIFGVYYIIMRGKSLQFTACFSSIAFIVIIGLFNIFGYGLSIIYERSFLYLFLFISIVAAIGLREIREALPKVFDKYHPNLFARYSNFRKQMILSIVIISLLVVFAVPSHIDTPYYKMISEKDYEAFTWIRDNLDSYRDSNHTYTTGAVDPYKASPFSAITGLYVLSSSMHPVIRYWNLDIDDMDSFLVNQCRNTSFLNRSGITVIYGLCDNSNLTMIHPNVYLYTDSFPP
jgi:hypothetical protein